MMQIISPSVASITIMVLLFLLLLYRVMRDENNDLSCWQFFSTRGLDGKQYADVDKLGKMAGIGVSSWVIIRVAIDGKIDATLLGVYLAYVGGVAAYSAYTRSKVDKGATQNDPPA